MEFLLNGDDACQLVSPSQLPNPYWVGFSRSAANLIGLELDQNGLPYDADDWLQLLAGNQLHAGQFSFATPKASVYSGHQFGIWAGQLGDGRAILLGEIAGQEIQLKGAGKTRYSRMGDGRAVLRSSIREFLCSEAMHALGIPTTRALAIIGSTQTVMRESIETAAVCARISPSFLRVGHFEHFASLNSIQYLQQLADHLIAVHYPECLDNKHPYLELFKRISARNAALVALWQSIGFCHGVLNTDNISLLGLTIDYGPFGFLNQFQYDHICNHSDTSGRYAYHNQPQIMHWNMACLASSMLPLLELTNPKEKSKEMLTHALEDFPQTYRDAWLKLFRAKLGLQTDELGDIEVIERLLKSMHENGVDFTCFFRDLSKISTKDKPSNNPIRNHFINREQIDLWLNDYASRLIREHSIDEKRSIALNRTNPKYILRNHLAQAAIEKAQNGDFSEVNRLLAVLSNPHKEQEQFNAYAEPPPKHLNDIQVSCSS